MQDLISSAKSGTNVVCCSITSDGGIGNRKAIEMIYPQIPHPRCIIPVQRLGLALLTRNPKTQAGPELRVLDERLRRKQRSIGRNLNRKRRKQRGIDPSRQRQD